MALSFIRGVSFERVTISSSKEYRNILLEENLSICFTLWNVNLKKKRNENNIVESFVSLLSILFNFVDSFIHQWVMLPTFPSILEKRHRWRIKQGSFFSKGWNILTVTHSHTHTREEIQFSWRKRSGQKMAGLCYTAEIHTRVKE